MPELPEVETIRRGIEPHVLGRRIGRVVVRDPRLRWPVQPDLPARLAGRRIEQAARRAKYLVLHLDNGDRLLIHLGMSGRIWVLDPTVAPIKHDHVDIELDSGQLLRFHDPRRFGAVLLWSAGEPHHELLRHLGPEPFDPAFHGDYLFELSRGRSAAVKNFVMDGNVVVGAGNIYAAESLFRAAIRPTRAAGKVTRAEYVELASRIREVLNEAIVRGGTTLRDFAGATGELGYFQQELYVYGREGEPCRRCGTGIRRKVIGQRSSFYCTRCQR
ncbi:DNA-(apurinic or apyrimidinic site) lyase [Panacagrimonas perspica]|uniref:Formamidopyrimidine-DNA glycosylase n=1 Tax=Panacagrimonas perspica TaxID=381431 RepID=A0A4S3K6F7_9GAMM|nr:bifunctional DNA-formamidopyrimidine glycosylase/DNA-(apurinic or apyrimidinic site) lyase [Panacagrimonas perspica]TDU25655.1 DNA-(apurinic or apyrimidinic site) lyase [Panacagrimonas perspica]THD03753.1 DNA-formamidopyrimidine glycosylase [Panacagrimonas perspica]